MATPEFFTVTADYKSIIADSSSDSDYLGELGPISATVTFTPLLQSGDVLLATTATPRPTGYVPVPVVGRIDVETGRLMLRVDPDDGGTGTFAPVTLMANTELLEIDGPLYYRVTFSEVVIGGRPGYLAPFDFEAPTAGGVDVNLIEVAPVPGSIANGIVKVSPGGVRQIDGTTIAFTFGGVDLQPTVSLAALSGPTGPTGATGATGAAATIAVGSVTSLPPGSTATVVNEGSSGAAVFSFGLVTGATGATGATGSVGLQGPQGVPGIQGPQGEAGVSLDINGTVATHQDLPGLPEPGDAYIVAADGKLYFFDGTSWPADGDGVPFVGPAGPQGIQGIQGLVGSTGDPGQAATIAVGTVTGGATAAVNNSGDSSSAVFDFTLPIGPTGDAATIAVGTVTALDPGQTPTVTNSGTSGAAVFDFGVVTGSTGAQGATGDAATIAVGTVTTGDPGTSASVTNSGNSGAAVFDFTIPAGPTGAAATIAIGTVTTGDPGTEASATNVGTETDAVIDLVIPRGATGSASGETWETLAGKPAVVAAGATEADARAAIDAEYTGNKGVAGGYPSLDLNGLVPQSQLPITTSDWATLEGKPAVVAAGATKADARTAIDAEYTGAKGQPNGYASLDASGRVPLNQLVLTAVDGGTPATAVFVDAIDGGTP